MGRRIVSGIMLTLLLASMLTSALSIQLVKAEPNILFSDNFDTYQTDAPPPEPWQSVGTVKVTNSVSLSSPNSLHVWGNGVNSFSSINGLRDSVALNISLRSGNQWNGGNHHIYGTYVILQDSQSKEILHLHLSANTFWANYRVWVSNDSYRIKYYVDGGWYTGWANEVELYSAPDSSTHWDNFRFIIVNSTHYQILWESFSSSGNLTLKRNNATGPVERLKLLIRQYGSTYFDDISIVYQPATIVVPDDYPTIQEAVNHANEGDTIFVRSGIYYEHVVVNKTVSLIGEDPANTIVDGPWFTFVLKVVADNVRIENFTITDGVYGIYLSSSGNIISGNTIYGGSDFPNWCGIYLNSSSGNSITGNTFVNTGLFVSESYTNVVSDNWVNGKPLVYLEGVSDYVVQNAGQVILVNCTRIQVENLNLSFTTVGVELLRTNDTKIVRNNITANFGCGIDFYSSSSNTVSGNKIADNWGGGIHLLSSSNNNISGNNIVNNDKGISLYECTNNKFHHNNLINNTQQVYDYSWDEPYLTPSINIWDDSYPSGGNYWSDYETRYPEAEEIDGSGIWDTPYVIDANNTDNYPLVNPWRVRVHNIDTGLGYYTIREAIEAVETRDGHTILVDAGTYYENVVVNKSVSLIGEDPHSTIVDGGGSGEPRVITVRANNTVIENFTLTNGGGISIVIHPEGPGTINNCIIKNNIIANNTGPGIDLCGEFGWILNITISGNKITNNSGGIVFLWSGNNTIVGNNITSNGWRGLMLCQGCHGTVISGNNIEAHYDSGISGYCCGSNIISGNNITNNGLGIDFLDWCGSNIISGNNITNNGDGINLCAYNANYDNIITENNVMNNNVGICMDPYPSSENNTIYHNNFIGNALQVNATAGYENVWDDGYPSGGNYWSDYAGVDFFSGPHQDEPRSDGIGDTPYVIDEGNQDNYPLMNRYPFHNIAVKDVTSQTVVVQGSITTILVEVVNRGHFTEIFNVTVYANTMAIQTQTVTNLAPNEQLDLIFTWNTTGFPKGDYIVWAYAHPVQMEICIADNTFACSRSVRIVERGYFIIVAGNDDGILLDQINYGCNEVFKILREFGYGGNEIYYMNQPEHYPQDVDGDGQNDIDALSTSANLQWAIETWASSRVTSSRPLFLYLFDHGNLDVFAIDSPDCVTSSQLESWFNTLEGATNAPIHVIYAACHSGSFIDELSKTGRVVVSSCRSDQSSRLSPDRRWELFSQPFWREIQSGHSVGWSFNRACEVVEAVIPWWQKLIGLDQDPLLDDNGDGIGHTGPLPNGGDGSLAFSLQITSTEWVFPWISYVAAKQFYTWPPPPTTTLWAKVENKTPLLNVRAWMQPYEWNPPTPDTKFISVGVGPFEMIDIGHDGNFTVDIPATNFTQYASGPSLFRFIITAEEENGMTAIPLVTEVEFVETFPSEDTSPPRVYLERPISGRMVQRVIGINGTATDDRSLERVALYVNGNFTQEINLPLTSNSFFGFDFNTSKIANGPATIFVEAFDTSGNSGNQTVEVMVNNFVHDIAVVDASPSKTVVVQGSSININVTIQNDGYFAETFNVTAYANTTVIVALTNIALTIGDSTTITFTWNTTGFAYGNYTVHVHATPVSDETDTADNTHTDCKVVITIAGDVNGDWSVETSDLLDLSKVYGSSSSSPNWDPNYDLNGDGKVDALDLFDLSRNYGMCAYAPPVIDSYYPLADPTISEGESQEFNVTYHDPDGDPLVVQWFINSTPTSTLDNYTFTADYDSARAQAERKLLLPRKKRNFRNL